MKRLCQQDDVRKKADTLRLATDNILPGFQSIQTTIKAHTNSEGVNPTHTAARDSVRSLRMRQTDHPRTEQSPLYVERPAEHHNSAELIKLWQAGTSAEHDPGQAGTIAQLLQGCIDLLSSLLSDTLGLCSLPKKAKMGLCRSLATLRLWADGHNVLDGQLDRILEKSKSLQYTTLTTLNALCGVLVNSKFLRP
jgi:hypothetical protein